jgi:hypothetical protein
MPAMRAAVSAARGLVIMGKREEAFRPKIGKDADQVAALVEFGLLRSPTALRNAAADLMGRGPGWRSRAAEGLKHVRGHHPEIAERLAAVLKEATAVRAKKKAVAKGKG